MEDNFYGCSTFLDAASDEEEDSFFLSPLWSEKESPKKSAGNWGTTEKFFFLPVRVTKSEQLV